MDNKVELLGYYGGDLEHALSAWTSTNRDLTEEKRKRIPKLLKYLAEHKHHTPFEKSTLHFLVTADIASHIHVIKHRINVSVNTESARYKELKDDKYYIPTDWSDRAKNRLTEHVERSLQLYHKELKNVTEELIEKYNKFTIEEYYDPELNYIGTLNNIPYLEHFFRLEKLTPSNKSFREIINTLPLKGDGREKIQKEINRLCRKRAKESARFYLPYATQLKFDVAFNWRSFAHFQGLRNKPDAQYEIRQIAQSMLDLVKNIEGNPFEHTIKAFNL